MKNDLPKFAGPAFDDDDDRTPLQDMPRVDTATVRASKIMGPRTVRYIVNQYYLAQMIRERTESHIRAATKYGEPITVLQSRLKEAWQTELNAKRILSSFTDEWMVTRWMKSIYGIGPVLSAGFQTHCDIRRAATVAHWWSFAGFNPNVKWEKGKLRPYNAKLKNLCFKFGSCMVRFSGREEDVYGKLYLARREYEAIKNDAGEYADLAKVTLDSKDWSKKDTPTKRVYESGKLPLARLYLRAISYTARIFMSHLHHVAFEDFYKKPAPMPYSFAQQPEIDHRHYIQPPNYPFKGGGRSLTEFYAQYPVPQLADEVNDDNRESEEEAGFAD